jgi:hypothetical protein
MSFGCPVRVKRVGFVMSAVCPVYPQQQTSPDTVGTSHLCHELTLEAYEIESVIGVSFVRREIQV